MRIAFLLVIHLLWFNCLHGQETAFDYLEKAIILQKENDLETSLLMCSKAIEADTGLTNAFFLRGYVNYLLENYNDAISDFTTAVNQKPDYFDAIYYRGKARQAKGDFVGAVRDYNQSRELNPVQATFMIARGLFTSIFGGDSKKGE
jgi:tetratricopeptide (TPR) repeat protein